MIQIFLAFAVTAALSFPGLRKQFEEIAPAAKGHVGIAAQLLESGETTELHGDEHFPMHSVYKLPISMAVLQRVDRRELKLDQKVKIEPNDFVRGPDSDAETLGFFTELLGEKTTSRQDIKTWFDLLDLDDYESFGGKV